MSVNSSSPLRRLWFQPQTTFNVIPNSSGTWTNTGAKFIPFTKADIRRVIAMIAADYKTGTGSMLSGIPGRASASGSFSLPFMPSGAAGTVPQSDALLANIFGQAATVVASTSVTYNQADGPVSGLIAALFNESNAGSSMQFAYGGAVGSFTLNIGGGGDLGIDADIQFVYDLESDNFANEDTAGKAGLTTYPAEPGSPTLTGNIIPSFLSTGQISIGGNSLVEFVSAQINGNTGRVLRYDGGKYATAIVQGRRGISLRSLKMADTNSANLTTLKNLAASKSAVDVVIVQGGTAGYTVTHTLKSVQFGDSSFSENGAALDVDFGDSMAHASALANVNDYVLALT
jgi:hypothetical protein